MSLTPFRFPSLIALATALLTLATVLTPGRVSAQDQQGEHELTIAFVDRPQHHGKGFKVAIAGLDPSSSMRIRECVGARTGDECAGGWGADAGRRFTPDASWRLAGLRWHLVDGEIADCAETECFLEVTNGDRRARRAIEYSTKYPMPTISGDFDSIVPGDVVVGKTNQFLRPNKFGRSVAVMQCVTDSSPLLTDNACEATLWNTKLAEPFQLTPLRSLSTGDGPFDCTATPGACELRVWSYPSPLAFPAGAPLTFTAGGGDEPELSATLSKTTDIKPFEKLALTVVSPYTKLTIAICATSTDTIRATCNKRRRSTPGLIDGRSSISTTRLAPGRFVTKANGAIDCADPDVECHLRVTSSGYQIAKIPLSFDASVPTEAPQIVAPKGPFTEGETIEVLLRGLKPNSKVLVQCWSTGCEKRSTTTAAADGTAAVEVTLQRDADFPDEHRHIRIKTQPKVRPSFIPISFE